MKSITFLQVECFKQFINHSMRTVFMLRMIHYVGVNNLLQLLPIGGS